MLNFSLSLPKNLGLSAIATTAFCTVLLVTSSGRFTSCLASNCRVHDMAKTEEAGREDVAFLRSVK